MRSRAASSEEREDSDADFSFLGEAGFVGGTVPFLCAACEGRLTVAVTVLACCACSATLRSVGLAVLWASWFEELMGYNSG